MKLFEVYPLFGIHVVKGKGCRVWDDQGNEYLDLYGGHAVIAIGHAHPHYVEMISRQVARLGFYSNSVVNQLQQEVADRLGRISGYDDYQLFLINSGAEAEEIFGDPSIENYSSHKRPNLFQLYYLTRGWLACQYYQQDEYY